MFKTKNLTDSGKAAPPSSAPTTVPGWPRAASAVATAANDTRIAWYPLRHSLVFVSLGCILLASSAHADTLIYNNITTQGGHVLNGGATEISGDDVTKMLADEITVAAGYGGARISGLSFDVANLGTSTVTAYAWLSFYSNNGTSGGPGTPLFAFVEEFTLANGFYETLSRRQ